MKNEDSTLLFLSLYYPRKRYRPGITNQNHRARNQEPHTLDHSRSSNPFIACVHGFGGGLTAIRVVGVLLHRGNFMGCALPVSIVGRYTGRIIVVGPMETRLKRDCTHGAASKRNKGITTRRLCRVVTRRGPSLHATGSFVIVVSVQKKKKRRKKEGNVFITRRTVAVHFESYESRFCSRSMIENFGSWQVSGSRTVTLKTAPSSS